MRGDHMEVIALLQKYGAKVRLGFRALSICSQAVLLHSAGDTCGVGAALLCGQPGAFACTC